MLFNGQLKIINNFFFLFLSMNEGVINSIYESKVINYSPHPLQNDTFFIISLSIK